MKPKPKFRSEHPIEEAVLDAIWDVVATRMDKLSADFPKDVYIALHHAEMNFWKGPVSTMKGGVPVVLIYPRDPSGEMQWHEPPDHVLGWPKLPEYCYEQGKLHNAAKVIFSGTNEEDNLLVLVVMPCVMYILECPILPSGTSYVLGSWQIERNEIETVERTTMLYEVKNQIIVGPDPGGLYGAVRKRIGTVRIGKKDHVYDMGTFLFNVKSVIEDIRDGTIKEPPDVAGWVDAIVNEFNANLKATGLHKEK